MLIFFIGIVFFILGWGEKMLRDGGGQAAYLPESGRSKNSEIWEELEGLPAREIG